MWTNIKRSLLGQIRLLFVVSFVVMLGLWGYFYLRQTHLQNEHAMARYFSIASSLQPFLFQSYPLTNKELQEYHVTLFTQALSTKAKIQEHRGDDIKGFTIFEENGKHILHIYNPIGEIYLEDQEEDYTLSLIHTIFLALLGIQSILFVASQKLLHPILEMGQKLKELQQGDFSKLSIHSSYKELQQIEHSYNHAIDYIHYLVQTREMFNKILMHELKTPLAKGMFYLKNEPSTQSHADIRRVFETINSQLDTFRMLEELIAYQGEVSREEHSVQTVLNRAIKTLHVKKDETIDVHQSCETCLIRGDGALWEICFKNLMDNALRYSPNHHVFIECSQMAITFSNEGESLPLDISAPIRDWKIERSKNHRSTSGYGFGLFIIKNIIELHGYMLEYHYENHRLALSIQI